MSRLDDPRPLDRSALIDLIYALQTDLKMLTEHLAREAAPDVPSSAVLNLTCLQAYLHQDLPSLSRH